MIKVAVVAIAMLLAAVAIAAQTPFPTVVHLRFTLPGNNIGVNGGYLQLQQSINWKDGSSTVWKPLNLRTSSNGWVNVPLLVPADVPGAVLHLDAVLLDANGNQMWKRSVAIPLSRHDEITTLLRGLKSVIITLEADEAP